MGLSFLVDALRVGAALRAARHLSRRLEHPKGHRVRLVMPGKFPPYKYYGAEQGVPEYGLKEE